MWFEIQKPNHLQSQLMAATLPNHLLSESGNFWSGFGIVVVRPFENRPFEIRSSKSPGLNPITTKSEENVSFRNNSLAFKRTLPIKNWKNKIQKSCKMTGNSRVKKRKILANLVARQNVNIFPQTSFHIWKNMFKFWQSCVTHYKFDFKFWNKFRLSQEFNCCRNLNGQISDPHCITKKLRSQKIKQVFSAFLENPV